MDKRRAPTRADAETLVDALHSLLTNDNDVSGNASRVLREVRSVPKSLEGAQTAAQRVRERRLISEGVAEKARWVEFLNHCGCAVSLYRRGV